VLDMRDLAFMDSSGLHAIIKAGLGARRVGRRLVLLRGPVNVDRLFTLVRSVADIEIGDVAPGEAPPTRCSVRSSRRVSSGPARRSPLVA
jgi:hypothetical protein